MMARTAATCIALAFVIAGCGPSGQRQKDDSGAELTKGEVREIAAQLVKPKLRDPDSAVFSSLIYHPGTPNRSTIICGYVNSRNGFGGMTGPQRFITGNTVMIEEEIGSANMDVAWKRLC
jgi:hypothetical protein